MMEERDDVLMLRRGQFVSETGGRIAYKIDEDIAYRTALEVGARSLSHIEILQGAEVGDQIILSSLASFGESDTVLITN
ncbi:MAG: HlyD family secretion protein [Enterobacterales bacterium]